MLFLIWLLKTWNLMKRKPVNARFWSTNRGKEVRMQIYDLGVRVVALVPYSCDGVVQGKFEFVKPRESHTNLEPSTTEVGLSSLQILTRHHDDNTYTKIYSFFLSKFSCISDLFRSFFPL
jgi:hypothetical protein